MKKKTYAPPRDSLAWRVCSYLTANPDEELMRGDVATKFGAEPAAIDTELAPAVAAGFLARVSTQDSGIVWRLTHRGGKASPAPFAHSTKAARRALRPTPFNIAGLKIESGIPLSEPMPRASQWERLFRRMNRDDSIEFPLEIRASVAHAKQKYRKQFAAVDFAIRRVSDTHCRIWRTA